MSEINKNLLQLRKSIKLNQTEFGCKLGVSRSVIQNLEGNKTSPSNEFIDLVCRIYSVNKEWLETGTGDMLLDTETAEMKHLSTKYNLSDIESQILKNYLDMDNDKRKILTEMLFQLTN